MAEKSNNLLTGLALLVGVAALGVSFVALASVPDAKSAEESAVAVESAAEQGQDIQYVLYVGTNDKDSNEPVFSEDDAREHLEAILTDHFGGFTIQDARGGWVNDDGSIAHEYTLVVYLSDTTLEEVHAACDDLIAEFNQSSILIQQNMTTTEFYSG
jgi:hypothetical protein